MATSVGRRRRRRSTHQGGVPGTPRSLLFPVRSFSSMVELELVFPSPYTTAGQFRLRLGQSQPPLFPALDRARCSSVGLRRARNWMTLLPWRRRSRWSRGRLVVRQRRRRPSWSCCFRYKAEFVQAWFSLLSMSFPFYLSDLTLVSPLCLVNVGAGCKEWRRTGCEPRMVSVVAVTVHPWMPL
jgi:hypothetical protein